MPAIKKISREAIINAAIDVLREGGAMAINARSIAKKLECSTQPIYQSFQNMDDLKEAMTQQAIALHTQYVRNNNSDTQYSCYGMGFVEFAKKEKYLFRWLYLDGKQPEQDILFLWNGNFSKCGSFEFDRRRTANIIPKRIYSPYCLLWGISNTAEIQKKEKR